MSRMVKGTAIRRGRAIVRHDVVKPRRLHDLRRGAIEGGDEAVHAIPLRGCEGRFMGEHAVVGGEQFRVG